MPVHRVTKALTKYQNDLERNEEAWFSLWSNKEVLGGGRLFTHPRFPDDPLFNHITGINVKPKEIEPFIKKILKEFKRRSIFQPAFYVSPLSRPRNIDNILQEKGFHLYDSMYIMSLRASHESAPSGKTNHGLLIEPAKKQTVKRWASVYAKSFDIEAAALPTIMECLQNVLSSKNANLYIGYTKKRAVSVGALYTRNGISGIYCLGTLKSFRGKGIASTLLSKLIDEAFALGSSVVCLQTLHIDGVKDFYLKRGFSVELTRKIYTIGVD